MKKVILITLAILCLGNVIAQKKDASIQRKINGIEKELNNVLATSKAAGFAVAIVKGKEIVYAKGFGYRDTENKTPVTPNTVFCIASCTKAFTASMIGTLEAQGKVDLNATPNTYIPELKFYNTALDSEITVKDLMTHRTGLPRHDESWRTFPTQSKEELLARIEFQAPFAPLRSKWYYNNFMYFIQGIIAERLTQQSWAENIEQNFFHPLEMTSSNTSITALKNNPEAATGYYFKDGITTEIDYYDFPALGAAGGINSSVTDMSKWMIAWLNQGQYNETQVLPSNYVKAAISSQMVIGGKLPRATDPNTFMMNYGYGWFISSYKGHYRVDHGGNIDGFSANVALYPGDDLGIVVLANQNRSGVPQIVTNIIADKIFKTTNTNWLEKLEELVAQQTKIQATKAIVSMDTVQACAQYVGTYMNRGYGTFDVVAKNDSLFAKFPSKTLWLNPVHPNEFETYYVEDDQVLVQYQDKSITFKPTAEPNAFYLEMKLEHMLAPLIFEKSAADQNQAMILKQE